MTQEEIVQKYFQYFEEKIIRNEKCSDRIVSRLIVIKKEFIYTLTQVTGDNILQSISKLLRLESGMQILLFFINSKLKFTDETILKISELEKYSYYKEMIGRNLKQDPPISLIFLEEILEKGII